MKVKGREVPLTSKGSFRDSSDLLSGNVPSTELNFSCSSTEKEDSLLQRMQYSVCLVDAFGEGSWGTVERVSIGVARGLTPRREGPGRRQQAAEKLAPLGWRSRGVAGRATRGAEKHTSPASPLAVGRGGTVAQREGSRPRKQPPGRAALSLCGRCGRLDSQMARDVGPDRTPEGEEPGVDAAGLIRSPTAEMEGGSSRGSWTREGGEWGQEPQQPAP